MEEALASYRRALAIDPLYAEVYTNYGLVRRLSDDAEICRLLGEAARRIETLPPPRRTHLHLALARLHDERDEIDEAFRHWREAAVLKRRALSYDPTQTDALVARLQGAFPPGPWAASRDHGAPSVLPIFVLGMPRSGTTLVEQILASHPQVHGGGELGLLPKALAGLDVNAEAVARPGAFAGGPDLIRRGEAYVAAMRALASGVTRITDKRPANALLIGPLHLVLPRAAVILCRRDLVDTCLSCFQTLFRQGHAWSYDLAELGHYARAHDRLMDHWRSVLPGRVLEVRYEELVADPEAGARRIVAHCGLSWDAACLSLDGAGRAVRTASVGQVRQQIHTRAVGRWRRYEHHLKPLLDALGPLAHQG
jgi:tetratricopeptide (TPR) repeat protein